MTPRHAQRADVDGLRAVAILPVVLFHSGVSVLAGGFTGVDVFFVISGFLITRHLVLELETRKLISIVDFYARRIARIFPALLLVVGVTVIAAAVLLSAALFEVHAVTKSAVASLGFVANFYILSVTQDYFSSDSRGLPLLHMWSLAVEEQYYLLWPIVMIGCGRIARRFGDVRSVCLAVVTAITLGSMIWCAWQTRVDNSAAFYLPLSRAWELGLGSILALIRREPGASAAPWQAWTGLILVAAGLAFAREGAGFPFPLALLPTVGTVLLIRAGSAERDPFVSRLLALPPLTAIGRVSYAWYLWHWPPLAFAYLLTLGQASLALKLALAAITLGLAFVTVRFVENPIRFGIARRHSSGRVVIVGMLSMFGAMGLAAAIYLAAHFGWLPGDKRIADAFGDRPALQEKCLLADFSAATDFAPECLAARDRPTVLLWGDSYVDQWSPAIAAWAKAHPGWGIEQLSLAACPPLIGVTPTYPKGILGQPYPACRKLNDEVATRIGGLGRPTVAVLGGNWLARAQSAAAGEIAQFFDAAARSPAASLEYLEQSLEATIGLLESRGIPVVLILQPPVPTLNPIVCVERLGADRCVSDRREFVRKAGAVNAVLLRAAARHPKVFVLDPVAILCGKDTCRSEIGGRIAYFDAEHVAASLAESAESRREWDRVLDAGASALVR